MKNKHIVLTDKQRKAALEHLNKKRNLDGSPKPINQYSLNGTFIEHFKSYKEASIAIGGNEKAFARAMREGTNKGYYKGYYWSSQKAETIPTQLLDLKTNRPRIPILQYDSNDNLIKIWKSYNEIAKAYGKCLTTIKDNITKHPNEYLGYKWIVLNNCSKQYMYQLFYGKKAC